MKRLTSYNKGICSRLHYWFNFSKSINIMHHIKRLRRKNHMIMYIDIEKSFEKIQHTFMMKNFTILETEFPQPHKEEIHKNYS